MSLVIGNPVLAPRKHIPYALFCLVGGDGPVQLSACGRAAEFLQYLRISQPSRDGGERIELLEL